MSLWSVRSCSIIDQITWSFVRATLYSVHDLLVMWIIRFYWALWRGQFGVFDNGMLRCACVRLPRHCTCRRNRFTCSCHVILPFANTRPFCCASHWPPASASTGANHVKLLFGLLVAARLMIGTRPCYQYQEDLMVKSHGHMSKFHPASVMVNIRSRKDHFLKFSPSWFLAKSHVFIFLSEKWFAVNELVVRKKGWS